jgi:ATPase family AAA domain-containing protein 3A/B
MDDYLGFPLPSLSEREGMLRLYYESLVVARALKGHEEVGEGLLKEAARKTDRFSGREISKLMLSVLNAVYGTADVTVSVELFRTVLGQKVSEHQQKERLMGGAQVQSTATNRKVVG